MPETCTSCGAPATRQIEYTLRAPRRRRTTEAFCETHGSWLLVDKARRPVERRLTPAP